MAQPKAKEMRRLVSGGKAMPAPGQSRPARFWIRNEDDLKRAIKAVGRVPAEKQPMTRKFIMRKARGLGLANRIPDTWNSDGTLKKS